MTIEAWLKELSKKSDSNERDSDMMAVLLRKIGYPKAICVVGVAYLQGKGTLTHPPVDIHTLAKSLLEAHIKVYSS